MRLLIFIGFSHLEIEGLEFTEKWSAFCRTYDQIGVVKREQNTRKKRGEHDRGTEQRRAWYASVYLVEKTNLSRDKATLIVGSVIALLSLVVVFNFETLFSFMITLTTERAQPLIALGIAIYLGWVWNRNQLINAIAQQEGINPNSLFWKVWPWYVKYICPLLIILIIVQLIS